MKGTRIPISRLRTVRLRLYVRLRFVSCGSLTMHCLPRHLLSASPPPPLRLPSALPHPYLLLSSSPLMLPTIDDTLVVMKRGKGEHTEAGEDTKEGAAEVAAIQALSESQRCVAFMDELYDTLAVMGKDGAAKTGIDGGEGTNGDEGQEGQEGHQVAMDQMKYYVRSSSSFVYVPFHIPPFPFAVVVAWWV